MCLWYIHDQGDYSVWHGFPPFWDQWFPFVYVFRAMLAVPRHSQTLLCSWHFSMLAYIQILTCSQICLGQAWILCTSSPSFKLVLNFSRRTIICFPKGTYTSCWHDIYGGKCFVSSKLLIYAQPVLALFYGHTMFICQLFFNVLHTLSLMRAFCVVSEYCETHFSSQLWTDGIQH